MLAVSLCLASLGVCSDLAEAQASVNPVTYAPASGTAAPGAWDNLSAKQKAAIRWNIVAARGEVEVLANPDAISDANARKLGQKVWDAEKRLNGTEFRAETWNTGQVAQRTKSGVLPRLASNGRTLARFAGRATPVASAGLLGITIGTGVTQLFGIAQPPPDPGYTTFSESRWEWTSLGGSMGNGAVVPGHTWYWRWRKPGGDLNTAYDVDFASWASPACWWFLAGGGPFGAREAIGTSSYCGGSPSRVSYIAPEDLHFTTPMSPHKPTDYPPDPNAQLLLDVGPLPDAPSVDATIRDFFDSAAGAFMRDMWQWILREHGPTDAAGELVVDDEPIDLEAPGSPMGPVEVPGGLYIHKDAYADRLEAINLVPRFVEAEEFDWEVITDGVVAVNPEVGSQVKRGSTVDVVHNPSTNSEGDEPADDRNRRCQLSPPSGADPLPSLGSDKSKVDQRRSWYVTFATYPRTMPDGTSGTVELRVGMAKQDDTGNWHGFGYRKIAAKHGYSLGVLSTGTDEHATATTLRNGTVRQAINKSTGQPFANRWLYTGVEYHQNGAVCRRRVVIDEATRMDPDRLGRRTGVISSFGKYFGAL